MQKYIYSCRACGTRITFETSIDMGSEIGCMCGGTARWIGSKLNLSMYENQVDFE